MAHGWEQTVVERPANQVPQLRTVGTFSHVSSGWYHGATAWARRGHPALPALRARGHVLRIRIGGAPEALPRVHASVLVGLSADGETPQHMIRSHALPHVYSDVLLQQHWQTFHLPATPEQLEYGSLHLEVVVRTPMQGETSLGSIRIPVRDVCSSLDGRLELPRLPQEETPLGIAIELQHVPPPGVGGYPLPQEGVRYDEDEYDVVRPPSIDGMPPGPHEAGWTFGAHGWHRFPDWHTGSELGSREWRSPAKALPRALWTDEDDEAADSDADEADQPQGPGATRLRHAVERVMEGFGSPDERRERRAKMAVAADLAVNKLRPLDSLLLMSQASQDLLTGYKGSSTDGRAKERRRSIGSQMLRRGSLTRPEVADAPSLEELDDGEALSIPAPATAAQGRVMDAVQQYEAREKSRDPRR